MTYLPHTPEQVQAMLARIGVDRVQDLFEDIPSSLAYPQINLPQAASEPELAAELRFLAESNDNLNQMSCFLGAGAYNHYVPAIVGEIAGRTEFYSAYTPYQAEISQGTLQSIYEYQTMICELTGMDVSNASHYDGATATAEAALSWPSTTVSRGKRQRKIVIAPRRSSRVSPGLAHLHPGHGRWTIAGDEAPNGVSAPDLQALVDQVDQGYGLPDRAVTLTFIGHIIEP